MILSERLIPFKIFLYKIAASTKNYVMSCSVIDTKKKKEERGNMHTVAQIKIFKNTFFLLCTEDISCIIHKYNT